MRVEPILILASSFLLMTACATGGDDYLLKGKGHQDIALGNAKEVLIRCYCPQSSIKARTGTHTVAVDVTGNYGSAGYHGKQEKPREMPASLLNFLDRNDGEVLILESKEWTYMHHFNLLTAVTVTAPPDVVVRFERIPLNKLHDRQVPQAEK